MNLWELLASTLGSFHAPWIKSLYSISLESSHSVYNFWVSQKGGSTLSLWFVLLKISILLHKTASVQFYLHVAVDSISNLYQSMYFFTGLYWFPNEQKTCATENWWMPNGRPWRNFTHHNLKFNEKILLHPCCLENIPSECFLAYCPILELAKN